jgi:hypothetical protein
LKSEAEDMSKVALLVGGFFLLLAGSVPLEAQNPVTGAARTEMLRNLRPSGQPVVPIFEGWYSEPDGSYGLCFGYHNLNLQETLDIPLGPDNFIEPTRFDGVQPTHFDPVPMSGDLRYYCVFTVNVPADFGNQDVVWTLRIDGQDYSVPGHITHFDYEIQEPDHRSLNSVAPLVRFLEPEGPEGRGRGGVWAGPMRTEVRNPLSLRIELAEPETTSPFSAFETVTARWAKHQGPGEVVFQHMDDAASMPRGTGLTTTATFSEPGNYILRVQAWEGRRVRWQSYCCWTNAYVEVTVTP